MRERELFVIAHMIKDGCGFLTALLGRLVVAQRQVLLAEINEHASHSPEIMEFSIYGQRLLVLRACQREIARVACQSAASVKQSSTIGQAVQVVADRQRTLQHLLPADPRAPPFDQRT